MREVKFRAWCEKHKEMYYVDDNYSFIFYKNGNISFEPKYDIEEHHIFSTNPIGDDILIEVYQYTGLHDKNGVEIYEGDILRVENNKRGGLVVEFINAYVGGWVLTHPTSDSVISLGARHEQTIEVIGNIHENKELI